MREIIYWQFELKHLIWLDNFMQVELFSVVVANTFRILLKMSG